MKMYILILSNPQTPKNTPNTSQRPCQATPLSLLLLALLLAKYPGIPLNRILNLLNGIISIQPRLHFRTCPIHLVNLVRGDRGEGNS